MRRQVAVYDGYAQFLEILKNPAGPEIWSQTVSKLLGEPGIYLVQGEDTPTGNRLTVTYNPATISEGDITLVLHRALMSMAHKLGVNALAISPPSASGPARLPNTADPSRQDPWLAPTANTPEKGMSTKTKNILCLILTLVSAIWGLLILISMHII